MDKCFILLNKFGFVLYTCFAFQTHLVCQLQLLSHCNFALSSACWNGPYGPYHKCVDETACISSINLHFKSNSLCASAAAAMIKDVLTGAQQYHAKCPEHYLEHNNKEI